MLFFLIAYLGLFLQNNEQALLNMAKNEIFQKRGAKGDSVNIKMIFKNDNETWTVLYELIPKNIGAHGMIEISKDFKIIDHQLGR